MEQTMLKKEVTSKNQTNDKLRGLDGIRAIACLMVIFHHLFQNLNINTQTEGVKEIQQFFISVANSGVSIFFILSGFLLSYPFWKKYLDNSSFPSIKNYILRRSARIIPGYYIAIIVSIVVMKWLKVNPQYLGERTLAAFTFTSGFYYKTFFPSDVNGALWSISFEVICYLLLPIFMFLLYKLGKQRNIDKAIIYWFIVTIIILYINGLVNKYCIPDNINKGWQYGIIGGAKYWMPYYNPVGFFAQFTIGIIAAGFSTNIFFQKKKNVKSAKFNKFDLTCTISLIVAFYLLWVFRYVAEFSIGIQHQPYFFPFFQIFIAIALIAAPHTALVGKLLDNPFFRYTANISFGLYIWHHLIVNVVALKYVDYFKYMGVDSFSEWLIISSIILLISYVIATLSFYFIEKPILSKAHTK